MSVEATRRMIASHGSLELAYPDNSKGVGAVIGRTDSPDLIFLPNEARCQPR